MIKIAIPKNDIQYQVCSFYEDINKTSDKLYQNYSELWNMVLTHILGMRKKETASHMIQYFSLFMGKQIHKQSFEQHKIIIEEYDNSDNIGDHLMFFDKAVSEKDIAKYLDILNDFMNKKRHTNWEYVSQSIDISIIKNYLENEVVLRW